jgi:hypothetical protein
VKPCSSHTEWDPIPCRDQLRRTAKINTSSVPATFQCTAPAATAFRRAAILRRDHRSTLKQGRDNNMRYVIPSMSMLLKVVHWVLRPRHCYRPHTNDKRWRRREWDRCRAFQLETYDVEFHRLCSVLWRQWDLPCI